MGLDDASKKLGVPRDTFALDMQDAGDPKSAITVVKKHLLNPIDVYISGYSNQSKAIAPELDRAGVTHFMISFDAFLAREGADRLRIFPNYKLEGPLYIDYQEDRGDWIELREHRRAVRQDRRTRLCWHRCEVHARDV